MGTSTKPRTLRRRIGDLSVGQKLFIGFAALTCVLALVIGCLFLTVARLGMANDRIVGDAAARSQAADDLQIAAGDLHTAQQAYVLDWPAPRTQFEQASTQFEAALQSLRERAGDPVTESLVQKIATGYQTFLSTDQLIWGALQSGDVELARNLTLGAESLAFGFIADDASKLSGTAEEGRLESVAAFDSASSDARTLGLGLGLAALVVMAIASWVITKLIRDPLHRVQLAAERAADGDLLAEADVDSDDETGRLARAFNSMLSKLRLREETLIAEHRRQETNSKVHRAFEMSDDEAAALDVVGLTMADFLPRCSSELLLANNSQSNLEQAVVAGDNPEGPGCTVSSPFSCVAVRTGSAVTFGSSTALDACPHLRNRGIKSCSAVCVPVTFMGHAIGVIHAVGAENQLPTDDEIDALTMLSTQAGSRIGMLRTMVRTQVQASTDSLTGLMNRRTFESRIRSLRRNEDQFVLVMADIDHFKRVNDTHGHQTGDSALKTFCEVTRSFLRQNDLLARWGGEEFALALCDLNPFQARDILDRIRLGLAARLSTSELPVFTVSFGIVDTETCASLEQAIRLADDALYEAKAQGRDCTIIASSDGAASAPTPPTIRIAEKLRSGTVGVLASLAHDDAPFDG